MYLGKNELKILDFKEYQYLKRLDYVPGVSDELLFDEDDNEEVKTIISYYSNMI